MGTIFIANVSLLLFLFLKKNVLVESFATGNISNLHTKCLQMSDADKEIDAMPMIVDGVNMTEELDPSDLIPMAPPLTFDKYMTMQDKRVIVSIQYSGESGLNPYYLTVAKKIKSSHPDVIIEKRILPRYAEEIEDPTFEVRVDGKMVVGKNNVSVHKLGPDKDVKDDTGGLSIFVSMMEMDLAISKARRRRRPETMYGKDDKKAIRLEMLRGPTLGPTQAMKTN